MPLRTKLQIALTLLAATGAAIWAAQLGSPTWLPFWLLLGAVVLSSGLKVELPRGDGSMSLNFPFILLGLIELSPLQAMLLTAMSVAAIYRFKVKTFFSAVQIGFNIANAMIATALSYGAYVSLHRLHIAPAPALACASVVYFVWNTGFLAMVIASSKGENALDFWRAEFPWYLPFYIVGAVFAAVAYWLSLRFGWATALLLIPAAYTLFRAYQSQITQIKERQRHLEETEALHLRTIEGLAMAIEAKDQNTHDHLFRVKSYVQAVGEVLGLDKLAMQALHTAAFLHDIGKLAVPEHIINKPGKLTPEEFEKMKIHPAVGADILERVRFPYPVVPIVRSHHEWWNGTGYPDGLKGEEIPIGARVLTVVDCFDALVSDRPYRKGMSSQQAMSIIHSMSGKQFDPAVVRAFDQCYTAADLHIPPPALSEFTALNTEVEVWRGVAPGAGFEAGSDDGIADQIFAAGSELQAGQPARKADSLNLIADACAEAQMIFEISQSLGSSLGTSEIVSVLGSRLHRLVPFDSCAFYLRTGDTLGLRLLAGAQPKSTVYEPMQLGEGISGWVAQSGKPLLNGNAAAEPGCPVATDGSALFQTALSIPLFDLDRQVFAVLTLYARQAECFSRDHLRALQAMEPKLAVSFENALQSRHAVADADTDFLTGLPNARRVFLELEAQLDQSRRSGQPIAVVVCDLNAFRDVNERRGQSAGNRLLTLIAEGLRGTCSKGETAARMGGDEFALLLPGTTQEDWHTRLRGIEEVVAAASRRSGSPVRLTASAGAAFYPEDGNSGEELLAAAERRMYTEKVNFYSASTALSVESRPAKTALTV